LKLQYVPSSGNFVMVKVGDDDGAGARVNLALLKQGMIVRPVGNYGLPQWLRITIGLPNTKIRVHRCIEKSIGLNNV
jgi:histidinol-phosphate aminotransferase